jgi:hypothetical protein
MRAFAKEYFSKNPGKRLFFRLIEASDDEPVWEILLIPRRSCNSIGFVVLVRGEEKWILEHIIEKTKPIK